MTLVRSQKTIYFVLFVAFFSRTFFLNIPLMEPYNSLTRQAVSGMVARNFYQHKFNFLYPELDENGRGPYLFNAEMPVYAYLMAAAYSIVGGAKEWASRSVSVVASLLTMMILYWFVRRRAGEDLAIGAAFFYALSPMSLALSRSVQPDAVMIFASIGALYAFDLYQESHRKRYIIGSATLMTVAIASKAYVLYLFLPLIYLAYQREGFRFLKNWRYYAYLITSLSALVWYVYMWSLGRGQHLAYETISYTHDRGAAYSSFMQVFSYGYLFKTLKVFFVHLLTPVGSLFFLIGFFFRPKIRSDAFFYTWFFSVVMFMLIFWRTAIDHPYYQLPFVLPCAFFVSRGFLIAKASKMGRALNKPVIVISLIVLSLLPVWHFYQGIYIVPKQSLKIVSAGHAVSQISKKSDLVVAASSTMPAQLLYYCNRKGWSYSLSSENGEQSIKKLEDAVQQDAAYFVTTEIGLLHKNIALDLFLRNHFALIQETSDYVIFDLRARS